MIRNTYKYFVTEMVMINCNNKNVQFFSHRWRFISLILVFYFYGVNKKNVSKIFHIIML